jgi:CRISPR-associated protein Cmr2
MNRVYVELRQLQLTVVRHVVEGEFLGRLIYAGGDDVLAMLPVADVLPCMIRLRKAYSGHDPDQSAEDFDMRKRNTLSIRNGFAMLNGRLMRMLGTKATASCGAVIAHHQAPLTWVMQELNKAEARAKSQGGRDAFSLSLLKRSGGALYLTSKWNQTTVLTDTRNFLQRENVSRRAVYHSLEWLKDLPEPTNEGEMLRSLLGYQLHRQSGLRNESNDLARKLTEAALEQLKQPNGEKPKKWLANFLSVAEFLAREIRAVESEKTND